MNSILFIAISFFSMHEFLWFLDYVHNFVLFESDREGFWYGFDGQKIPVFSAIPASIILVGSSNQEEKNAREADSVPTTHSVEAIDRFRCATLGIGEQFRFVTLNLPVYTALSRYSGHLFALAI